MAETREAKLRKTAHDRGLELEKKGDRYRVVDATTGTLVAADWTTEHGFGLSLADVEAALS